MFTYICVYRTGGGRRGKRDRDFIMSHCPGRKAKCRAPLCCQECCFHFWDRYRMCRMWDSGSQHNQQRIVRRWLHIVDTLLPLITKSRDVSRAAKGYNSSTRLDSLSGATAVAGKSCMQSFCIIEIKPAKWTLLKTFCTSRSTQYMKEKWLSKRSICLSDTRSNQFLRVSFFSCDTG